MPDAFSSTPVLLIAVALAYLLGSIPFGVVMSRLFGLGDLRQIGSGNIGATNVLRTGNKKAAALTLIFDAAKGGIAVWLAREITGAEGTAQLAGAAAFIGHIFPIWLGFKGGKGVATFLGILLVAAWPVGLAACAIWLIVAFASRYSSASALVAAAASPFVAYPIGRGDVVALAAFLAVAIWITHRENIRRLLAGTESKIGNKAKAA